MSKPGLRDVGRTLAQLASYEAACTSPSASRVVDYFRGGGHTVGEDRALADELLTVAPGLRTWAWSNRLWLRRVVAGAVVDGISQILDLGCGLPTQGCVHDIAHAVNPSCRVVYVDRDPVAVAHTQMVLDGLPTVGGRDSTGRVDNACVFQASLQDVDAVLRGVPEGFDMTRRTLVILSGSLQFVPDEPAEFIRAYRDAVAPGSLLALSHLTADVATHGVAAAAALWDRGTDRLVPRTRDQVQAMLEAWGELLTAQPAAGAWKPQPEVAARAVYLPHWRPDDPGDPPAADPSISLAWCGVARKLGRRRVT